MKLITILFGLISFFALQNSGCNSPEKVLKNELTSEEIAQLKTQPDCIKSELVHIYNDKGSLDGVNLIESKVNGEQVYYVNGKLINKSCDEVTPLREKAQAKELEKNAKAIVGSNKIVSLKSLVAPKATPKKGAIGQANCIKEKIDFFVKNRASLSMSQIYKFTSKGEVFYMFDEGMAVDGPAYVLAENCDTVCVTGGMRRTNPNAPTCPKADENSRQMIWVKGDGFVK